MLALAVLASSVVVVEVHIAAADSAHSSVVVVVVAEVHIAAVDTAHSSFVEVVGFGTAEFGFAELDWRVLELM